ncbi:hypothetical protein [Pseudoflavonifractor sp. MSJ-37]|uniref:hypothetical protein n=1 Tax=Pseudoflavonifractor sp. MSJ-37 TaxID=2841531 RepID=UPI001C128DF3|nr:hypothetical protein [Pseudoflavonifractor sp. MSJ-37]MBU5434678.1 hypothetical protein [Pseudoflavonifractor sp. MSJ-37]
MVFCADRGKPLVLYKASTMEKVEHDLKCCAYGKKGKTVCTTHHIHRRTDTRAAAAVHLTLGFDRRAVHLFRQHKARPKS